MSKRGSSASVSFPPQRVCVSGLGGLAVRACLRCLTSWGGIEQPLMQSRMGKRRRPGCGSTILVAWPGFLRKAAAAVTAPAGRRRRASAQPKLAASEQPTSLCRLPLMCGSRLMRRIAAILWNECRPSIPAYSVRCQSGGPRQPLPPSPSIGGSLGRRCPSPGSVKTDVRGQPSYLSPNPHFIRVGHQPCWNASVVLV